MSVYETNGIWRYRFMLNGHRYFATLPNCKTKTQAKAEQEARRTRIREGKDGLPTCGTNFKHFVEEEFLPHVKATKSIGTYKNYKWRCHALIEVWGDLDLKDITTGRIDQFIREQQRRVTSRKSIQAPVSINGYSTTLCSIFTRAERVKLVDPKDRPRVEKLKAVSQRIRYVTVEEERRLREAAKPWPYLDDMIAIYLATGMRREELFGLRKEHLDFDLNIISVLGKGSKLRRIPLDPSGEARAILMRLSRESPTQWLFTSSKGNWKFTHVSGSLRAACQDAKIEPPITLHVLRHTFCTRLAAAGVDIRTIQELAGHSNIATTVRYTHLVESKAHAAIRQLTVYGECHEIATENVIPFARKQA